MTSTTVGLLVFLFSFGGALAGMRLRSALPDHHVDEASKSTIASSIGLVATMTALVLGLVTASAKSSYDAVDTAVKQSASQILTLDRTLARYGPEAKPIRDQLQRLVAARIAAVWPEGHAATKIVDPVNTSDPSLVEHVTLEIRALVPTTDLQRALQSRAIDLAEQLLGDRWSVLASTGTGVPTAFLAIMTFWLAMTFASFGLFAPRNFTVYGALLVSAISVSCAIFLVLELESPFDGLLRIGGEPMRQALQLLNR